MRAWLVFVVLLVSAGARATESVTVQLDWVVRGDHAMFFVARDKGYFAREGIEINAIRRGTGSSDALRMVGGGGAQFGFADLPTLMIARAQGVPALALVAVNQKSPLAVISIAAKHRLERPADLKGLNIGIHPAGSTYIFFKAFLAANGLSLSDVTQSSVSPPYENYLLLGRVDAIPGYLDAEVPELEAKAGGPGSLSILQGAAYGYVAYGSGVFTSETLAKQKPELVGGFVKAYAAAFADAIADPGAAVDVIIKANPEYAGKRDVLLAQLHADISATMFDPDTATHGIGWISADHWTRMAMMLKTHGALPADATTDGAFDTTFLAAAQPVKR